MSTTLASTSRAAIACVTFDLDDTLWDIGPVVNDAETGFYAWLRDNHERLTHRFELEVLNAHRRRFYNRFPHMKHDFSWLRRRWLEHLAEEFSLDTDFIEQAFDIYWRLRNRVILYPQAEDVLIHTAARFKTGVITNGNACVIEIGIDHHFDFVVSAASAGVAKPHPRIFEAATVSAAVEPSAIVHVGDDPERDVRGAKRAGMRAIWYNPTGARWSGDWAPCSTVQNLRDLPAAIDAL